MKKEIKQALMFSNFFCVNKPPLAFPPAIAKAIIHPC